MLGTFFWLPPASFHSLDLLTNHNASKIVTTTRNLRPVADSSINKFSATPSTYIFQSLYASDFEFPLRFSESLFAAVSVAVKVD